MTDWLTEYGDIVATKLSGVVGAFVSMRFLSGTFKERASSALAGVVTSFYSAPWVAMRLGLPEGLAGFLIGLFGMAVCSRIWIWVQSSTIADVFAMLGKNK